MTNPMTSELRAAAERLNEYVTREIDIFTDEAAELDEDMGEEFRQVLKDTATLSKAYLATHRADDAEPITVETWAELFGDKKEIKSDIGVRLTFSRVSGSACVWLNGEILWLESHPKAHITDRRQLRDLLSALGVTGNATREGVQGDG